ncbi:RNA 3'-terminal phosphate cyclase [Cytospora mali]|uniref:RNA 3'-terminal phosphate cyclase n=1 Tax=Cytospora mali TaxID=578113 RepID=A0A194UWE3_CYTMA|nr:RNA 3'-terminal phosphate cyclase [Valsa mali var. pyri (nom. inval.)]
MGSTTGENGLVVLDSLDEANGQAVRIAITLSAITLKPVRIGNIRRSADQPGLTSHLVAIIKWLADQTGASVEGNALQSQILTFRPKQRPSVRKMVKKEIEIRPGSMLANSVLHFQTVLPFLLYLGCEDPGNQKPFELRLTGVTYSSDAPSFEYLDQVFLPALKKYFNVDVARKLIKRGWDKRTPDPKCIQEGTIRFKVLPLKLGTNLALEKGAKFCTDEDGTGSVDNEILSVDVTIITPPQLHESLKENLSEDIEYRFPGAEVSFKIEDSGFLDRVYVLLVGKAEHCRWGRDYLMGKRLKDCVIPALSKEISSKCLAKGKTCFDSAGLKGGVASHDSQQTYNARKVATAMLPDAKYGEGNVCIGAGVVVGDA